MNILFIANHLNTGGISSYLYTLGCALKERGHNVHIASGTPNPEEKFSRCGLICISAPLMTKSEVSPKIIFSFFKLRKEISKLKIDLIHSNSRTTQVAGNLLSRHLNIPHVFTCHGFFKPKLSRLLFPCWGSGVIAISREVKEHLVSDLKLDEKKICVINNGIDTGKFGDFSRREVARGNLGAGDSLVAGIIARLSDVKGHIFLLRAMALIRENFPNAKLLIIGEGKTKNALLKEIDNLGIKDNVLLIPEAKNTQEMLSAMDVFVMPSLQEGLGLSLMEAMAQGLAVVGSSVGGIKSLIRDNENGLLIEPADTGGLSQAIIKLFKDPQMRANLGRNARKYICENFSKEKMAEDTERFYKKYV